MACVSFVPDQRDPTSPGASLGEALLADVDVHLVLLCAFDADQLLNPGKVFPHLHRCAELGRLHVHKGKMPFADLPRF